MLLSLWPTAQQPWSDLAEVVEQADSTGWHAVYVADHFMGDGAGFGPTGTPTLEATAALAALAGRTTRVRLGSLVLGNTYRHPAVVANWAATLDHASGGRAILGVGTGWQLNEHRQYGIELPRPGERVVRLDEACSVLRGLLHDPPATFDGRYYQLHDAHCSPSPVQGHLPLLVGGKGDRMLGLVARHADAWNMWGLPSTIAERGAVLDRRCEAIDRDPSQVHRSTQALVQLTDDPMAAERFVDSVAPRAAFGGTASQFARLCADWAAVGVDEVIVPDWFLGQGAERAEALEQLRSAVT